LNRDPSVDHIGDASERGARADARAQAVRRLLDAAGQLATTIAATEELSQRRAELLGSRATIMSPRITGRAGNELISLADASRRSGRHPEVLRRWCSDGRIPAVRIGRTWAITPDTLGELMRHAARSRPRFARTEST